MKSLPTRLAMLAALVLAGCDSNPGAPSVPTTPAAGAGVTAAPAGAPKAPAAGPRKGRSKAQGVQPNAAD